MFRKIIGVFKGSEESEAEPPFGISRRSKVLDTEHERIEVKADVYKRDEDLQTLKSQIREHWDKYQYHLKQARDNQGIDELEAKTKAKEAKKAALDGETLYKLLWKELAALRNALRKDEHVKIVAGESYSVSLSEINNASVEKMAEEYRSLLRSRNRKVDEFQEGVNRMEEEEVDIDFSDIEKDVAELEMQDMDVDIFVEPEAEGPEIEAEETEWD